MHVVECVDDVHGLADDPVTALRVARADNLHSGLQGRDLDVRLSHYERHCAVGSQVACVVHGHAARVGVVAA